MAGELRVLARSLLTARGRAGRGAVGGVALAVALAALVAEIAAWQAARGRDHQAAAARRTATDATELVLEHPPAARPGRARLAGGGNGRARGTPRPRGGSGRSRRRQNSEPTMTPPTGTPPHRIVTAPSPAPPGSGTGLAAHAVGGSVVTDRQEQAVLAVVRLIGDQDVQVTAQHASSTSAAVTVRIGRALLYLNDQATAGHFHKVWFDAAAHARTLPPVGHPAHRGLVRALRGMPEPGIVANAAARPACSVAMVGGDPPDGKPFLRIQLGRVAFEIRDFAAYRSCLGAFRQAHHMARDVFLPCRQRTGLQRRAHRRPRRLLPPHPRRPGPCSEPAGHDTGRRVAQVTERSAPITAGRPAAGPGRRIPSELAQIIGERTDRMSTPDYPLLTVPGYELYQLAHLTTFAVDALARHRRAAKARSHPDRQAACCRDRRPMQLTLAPHGPRHPPAGFRPRRPPCPAPGLRRSTAPPPAPAVTALQPDLAPLPLCGRRRPPHKRPHLRPGRPQGFVVTVRCPRFSLR